MPGVLCVVKITLVLVVSVLVSYIETACSYEYKRASGCYINFIRWFNIE